MTSTTGWSGAATRREVRTKKLIHRSTYILVFNSANQLFLHKRSSSKDMYPGSCDPAVRGVVLAGESYDEGAGVNSKKSSV